MTDPLLAAAERDAAAAQVWAVAPIEGEPLVQIDDEGRMTVPAVLMVEREPLHKAAMNARVEHLPMSLRQVTQQDIDVVDAVLRVIGHDTLPVYKGVIR